MLKVTVCYIINGFIIIKTLCENPSWPPFAKGRDLPSSAKRGRGDFTERVHSISRPLINTLKQFD
jgi:hypothetical protein